MKRKRMGKTGPLVSELGLGCMGMSDFYGPHDERDSLTTIHQAIEAGVNWLDTGDLYGMGENELLIRKALKEHRRDAAVISVKFGAMRDPAMNFIGIDARPQAVKNFLTYSLRRLGTDYIDVYMPARLDPQVPIEETVGAMAELQQAGYIKHLALSEVSAATLARAHQVAPICAVQMEYSLISRGIEQHILPMARSLGVAVMAYGVLSRGLLSGRLPKKGTHFDFRQILPRFQGENLQRNLHIVDKLKTVAARLQASPAQLAIAWLNARGDDVFPLIGARTPPRLQEALDALALSPEDSTLDGLVDEIGADAVQGSRYAADQMPDLDSETTS